MGITAGVGALIGGVVGGGASIAGGILGSNAASDAASTQAAAANHAADISRQNAVDALNFNKQTYGNSLNIMAPWINTGQAANSRLGYLMGLNPNQGLPPGVINPNAPQGQSRPGGGIPGGAGSVIGFPPGQGPVPSNATGNGSGFQPFQGNPNLGQAGMNGVPLSSTNPTGPNGVMTSSTNGGAAGLLGANGQPLPGPTQPGSLGNLGGSTNIPTDINPGPLGNIGGTQFLGDQGGPTTLGNIGGNVNATNQDGTNQVGRTDGGPQPAPGNAVGPSTGLGNIGSGGPGAFGSLAQGWGQTFQSPTNVTEQNDPGYQFRLQQGQKALEASAAARGGLLTGGTSKAINDYAQNSASGEYSNVYNRSLQNYMTNYNTFSNDQSNLFNRLSALSGTGQTTAGQLSSNGMTASGQAGNILMGSAGQIGQQLNNAGAANASGYVGSANALGGGLSGAANSISGSSSLYQLLNSQKRSGGTDGV